MTKNINCLVDHKGAPCTCDLSMYERPMSNSTQNEVLYTAWNCPHEPLGHFVCEKATQKDIDEHLATHTNDHETHNVCNERLEREGSKATCCDCDPHEGCTLGERVPEASKTIKKDWAIEYIKMRTTNTSTISQEVDYIDTLLADARREVIEKVEKGFNRYRSDKYKTDSLALSYKRWVMLKNSIIKDDHI